MHDHHDEPRTERTPAADHATQRRAMLAGLGGLAAGAMLTRTARAGDLDPPAGPVGPTMKRLDEIEARTPVGPDTTPGASNAVFVISQPGSYYLTGNIAGEAGKHGVLINSADVTLDLNGFALIGVADSLSAVQVSGNRAAIRNGSISGWGVSGVNSGSSGLVLEHLRSWENASRGITIGNNAIVAHCSVFGNGDIGIRVGGGSAVRDCVARQNGSHGVAALEGSAVTGCATRGNGGNGIDLGPGAVVTNCTAVSNIGGGVICETSASVLQSTAQDNNGDGIRIGQINAENRPGLIAQCLAKGNGGDGVVLNSGGHARGNVCTNNGAQGLYFAGYCLIEGNTCDRNAQFGIYADAAPTRGRVINNDCTANSRGIVLVNTQCIVWGNTAAANPSDNYELQGGNRFGPIINLAAVTPVGVGGSSGPSTLATTDPWANFAY
jgi:hypothetical protein